MVVTVDEIKQLLPDDLLALLTDEMGVGIADDRKLAEIINNATEYFKAKLPEAPEAVIDESVRNYVIGRLYAYAGNFEMARTYEEMLRLEEQTYYMSIRAKREQQMIQKSDQQVSVSSLPKQFTDEEFALW